MILARARSHWRRPLGEELMQPVLPALAQTKESSAYTQKTYRPLHAMCRPRRRPFSPTYAGPVSGVSWVSLGGQVGFVIEFGGVCYQDTYPDVSCVYPAGYTYPDVS